VSLSLPLLQQQQQDMVLVTWVLLASGVHAVTAPCATTAQLQLLPQQHPSPATPLLLDHASTQQLLLLGVSTRPATLLQQCRGCLSGCKLQLGMRPSLLVGLQQGCMQQLLRLLSS
jgi:hypothetical protein